MLSSAIRLKTAPIHAANFLCMCSWLTAIGYVVGGKPGFVQSIPIPTARRMMIFGFLCSFAVDGVGILAAWRHRDVRSAFLFWFIIQAFFFAELLLIFRGFDSITWFREAFQWR